MIDNHKNQGKWKIQLVIAINFVFTEDSDETRTMHTESDNIEIITGNQTVGIIEELFNSFL